MRNDPFREQMLVEDIEQLEVFYRSKYGSTPINLSNWDPSKEFKAKANEVLFVPDDSDPISYVFSFSIDAPNREALVAKLGGGSNNGCLVTPAGSVSIQCSVNLLYHLGIKRILLISPSYFSVRFSCQVFGIKVDEVRLGREKQTFSFDGDFSGIDAETAVWITNPIYCTSVYYSSEFLNAVQSLLDKGRWVCCDENLCVNGRELLRLWGKYDTFIGLYSPHKSICVNGKKFSATVFPKKYQAFMDRWADILYGCLSVSCQSAVHHFLSGNYSVYSDFVRKQNLQTKKYVLDLCDISNVQYDASSEGYLMTVYFPHIPSTKGNETLFLKKLLLNTGITCIPGSRNHFPKDCGFSFRINLCSDNAQFRAALVRTIRYLTLL